MFTFVPALALTAACAVVAYRLRTERVVTFWLLWSGFIHVLLEGSYGLFHSLVKVRAETTFSQFLVKWSSILSWFDPRWWARAFYEQYARYDARYVMHDPLVIFFCYIELVLGPLCFFLAYLVVKGHRYRHPVQLMLCTAQLYGTILYFFSPVVAGTWSAVMTSNVFELIVFVVLLNGLWIAVPCLMMYQSVRALVRTLPRSKS